jgi:hypothetical protein
MLITGGVTLAGEEGARVEGLEAGTLSGSDLTFL